MIILSYRFVLNVFNIKLAIIFTESHTKHEFRCHINLSNIRNQHFINVRLMLYNFYKGTNYAIEIIQKRDMINIFKFNFNFNFRKILSNITSKITARTYI